MYLSRLMLNPRSRQVQREVADVYQMHRTILGAFPKRLNASERVLFRLESHPRTGELTLLVQSHGAPDWSLLTHQPGSGYLAVREEPNPWVKTFDLQLARGQELVFRLRANPTVKREGKRCGLYREEEQLGWLGRKAGESGFRLLAVRVTPQGLVESTRYEDDQKQDLRLLATQFDGVLQVTDPERLIQSVRQGIGSGKGLGFGLLSLAAG